MTLLKLYRLPEGVKLIKTLEHPNSIEYIVSCEPKSRVCPVCLGSNCVKKDHKVMSVKHLPLNNTGTFITFDRQRFRCKDCKTTFNHNPEWIHPDLKISMSLYRQVILKLTSCYSQIDIATSCCIPAKMVSNILNSIQLDHPATLPEALGMDEFHGNVGVWDKAKRKYVEKDTYLTTVCDMTMIHDGILDKNGRNSWIIDVFEERSIDYLKEFFSTNYSLEERKKVLFFCCDMFAGFTSLAKQLFPNANICYDMFHIVKRLNRAISLTRTRVMRSFIKDEKGKQIIIPGKEGDYKFLTKASRLLQTSETNYPVKSQRRKDRLQRCFNLSPDIEEVYYVVQEFHIIKDRKRNYSPQDRLNLLNGWIHDHKDSSVVEVRDVVRSISKWKPYIFNTWRFLCSNASSEGLNRKIKEVKRNACGYHLFKPFRNKIILNCGPAKTVFRPYSIRKEKRTIIHRGKAVSVKIAEKGDPLEKSNSSGKYTLPQEPAKD